MEQAIAGIIPNMGGQEAAVAGSQAVIFTATDRELIEERGGKIDKTKTFLEVLKKRPLTPEVENEQSDVKPEMNLHELEGRKNVHKKMLKHSALFNPQERVAITNKLPDEYEASQPVKLTTTVPPSSPQQKVEIAKQQEEKAQNTTTVVAAERSEARPAKDYDTLKQDQERLSTVKSLVQEYHLKRLFTDNEKEFHELSEKIKQESAAAVNPAARTWLYAQLTKITLGTARYKLKLLTALQDMDLDDHHKRSIKWLTKTIDQLAQA
ncbi:MAG: hypothetical protein KJ732_03190 [Candidatus Margulisbacteria bacterium]|nr:hypothetical protein [Candidatus Margulisiibacteriota bacterium]